MAHAHADERPEPPPGVPAGVEVEWQFDVPDLDRVARWLRRGAGGGVRSSGTRELVDVYLDTADWRLMRANRSLRIRERAGRVEATLKSLDVQADGPRTRIELTQELPSANIATLLGTPGVVHTTVHAVAGREPLLERGRVRTERANYEIATGRPRTPVATLSIDRFAFGPDGASPMTRVEVEVHPGVATEDVMDFVERLTDACELTPASGSKFELAIAHGSGSPTFEAAPRAPSRDATFGEVAAAALATQLHALRVREPVARLGVDPEGVHDVRVAIRRLRAAFALLGDAFDIELDSMRRELRWLGGALGGVRDLDVLLEELARWEADGPAARTTALAPLHTLLEGERETTRAEMLAALDSDRHSALVAALRGLLDAEALSASASEGGKARGAVLLRQAHRKFAAGAARTTLDAPDAIWHELRIRGKRLRYVIEFFIPVIGRPAERALGTLKQVQDVLGEVQDAVVASERLAAIVEREAVSPLTAFALGEWAGVREARAMGLRTDFAALLERFGEDWRHLRATFAEPPARRV